MSLDLKKIAIRIASRGRRVAGVRRASDEIFIDATMNDGSGQAVEYCVEFAGGGAGPEISKVVRKDVNQEIDTDSFKTVYGRKALEALFEKASEKEKEVEDARSLENTDDLSSPAPTEEEPMPEMPDTEPMGEEEPVQE